MQWLRIPEKFIIIARPARHPIPYCDKFHRPEGNSRVLDPDKAPGESLPSGGLPHHRAISVFHLQQNLEFVCVYLSIYIYIYIIFYIIYIYILLVN